MRKGTVMIRAIKIGAAALIGTAAGIFLILKLRKDKQISMQTESTFDTIKNTVRNKADDIQDTMANAVEEADSIVKTVHRKAEDVTEDVVHDYHKIKKNIDRKAEDISDKINNHVK